MNSDELNQFFVFSFSSKCLFPRKWINGLKKIEKRIFLWVKFIKLNYFSAAYLKLLFSLLNSNQRENLILKNGYVFSLL